MNYELRTLQRNEPKYQSNNKFFVLLMNENFFEGAVGKDNSINSVNPGAIKPYTRIRISQIESK